MYGIYTYKYLICQNSVVVKDSKETCLWHLAQSFYTLETWFFSLQVLINRLSFQNVSLEFYIWFLLYFKCQFKIIMFNLLYSQWFSLDLWITLD